MSWPQSAPARAARAHGRTPPDATQVGGGTPYAENATHGRGAGAALPRHARALTTCLAFRSAHRLGPLLCAVSVPALTVLPALTAPLWPAFTLWLQAATSNGSLPHGIVAGFACCRLGHC